MTDQKYFSKINEFGIIERVILAPSIYWVNSNMEGFWIQSDSPGSSQYPGIGWYYDISIGKFIPPIPFDSWILDQSGEWKAPVDYPNDNNIYDWNEVTKNWTLREIVSTEENHID